MLWLWYGKNIEFQRAQNIITERSQVSEHGSLCFRVRAQNIITERSQVSEHGSYYVLGCPIMYNQAIAANETPDVANPSIKAYSECNGKKTHDATIEICKRRKIELAEIERKRAAEEASDQAPATKITKRSFLVRCGWCNGSERRTKRIVNPATYQGHCECGGKLQDGKKRQHLNWLY